MRHDIKETINKETGKVTFFVDGRRATKEYVRFLESIALRQENFLTQSIGIYRYQFKSITMGA